jgi:hypothetical protein
MSKMKIYSRAAISFKEDDEIALASLLTVCDEDGNVIKPPPEFPLTTAQLVFNGDQATISNRSGNGRYVRLCRLVDAKLTEPRKDGDPIVVTGTSEELRRLGFDNELSMITATITKYAHCATC